MHVLKCRSEHSHRGMAGAGTGVGDLVEGIWAHFGKYGRRYALMSSAKRLTLLSANIDEWNRQKDVRFVPPAPRPDGLPSASHLGGGAQVSRLF